MSRKTLRNQDAQKICCKIEYLEASCWQELLQKFFNGDQKNNNQRPNEYFYFTKLEKSVVQGLVCQDREKSSEKYMPRLIPPSIR